MKAKQKFLAPLVLILSLGMAMAHDTIVGKGKNLAFGPNAKIDNLIICDGAKATLNGVRIKGNIKVLGGGKLCLHGSKVRGSIQAEHATGILINGGTCIQGNLQVKKSYGKVRVCAAVIKGDVQLEENQLESITLMGNDFWQDVQLSKNSVDACIAVKQNDIGGNLQLQENDALRIDLKANAVLGNVQVFKNYVGQHICISDNYIGGNLQCGENDPDPIHDNNQVDGNTECND